MSQMHPIKNEAIMLITTVTKDRRKIFEDQANAREAIEALYRVQERYPFLLYGFVIMPDHGHYLMQVPEPNTISKVMQVYKYGLTFNLGIGAFWQRGFYIRMPVNASSALSYIHNNPLKAGFVVKVEDYRWSSGSGLWDVSPLPFSI